MMNKGFSWILVVFWLVTLAMLAMDKGMMAMYMMVIGMLVDSLYSALHKCNKPCSVCYRYRSAKNEPGKAQFHFSAATAN